MSECLRNSLAEERERLGWSQARMAEAAGVSRQSYAAIESGSSVPSTEVALRLSTALGRSVSELFRLADRPGETRVAAWSGATSPTQGARVRLTRVGGRWIAHPCAEAHRPGDPADGVVERVDVGEPRPGADVGLPTEAGSAVDVGVRADVMVRLLAETPPHADLAVVGCDPAFGIVADELRRGHGIEVSWSQGGSRAALQSLARGEAHVAGAHLQDPTMGTWNAWAVGALVPFPCTRISFAVWQQALLVRPDSSKRVHAIGDLARASVRLLNREEGSGSRVLLDEVLASAGVEPASVEGYETAARGHLSVADGIAAGAADAGVAIRAAASARGLTALPIREEAYELIVPDHFLELPAVDALLGLLRRPRVRAQVEALDGYDVEGMGRVAS